MRRQKIQCAFDHHFAAVLNWGDTRTGEPGIIPHGNLHS